MGIQVPTPRLQKKAKIFKNLRKLRKLTVADCRRADEQNRYRTVRVQPEFKERWPNKPHPKVWVTSKVVMRMKLERFHGKWIPSRSFAARPFWGRTCVGAPTYPVCFRNSTYLLGCRTWSSNISSRVWCARWNVSSSHRPTKRMETASAPFLRTGMKCMRNGPLAALALMGMSYWTEQPAWTLYQITKKNRYMVFLTWFVPFYNIHPLPTKITPKYFFKVALFVWFSHI